MEGQEAKKKMVNYEQLEQKLNLNYRSKVEKRVNILTQCQGLLEGQVGESTINEVNRIKNEYNAELDDSGQDVMYFQLKRELKE